MSELDNFKKPSVISEVAYNKNKDKFLPRNVQIDLNDILKDKLFRFYDEMKTEESRPVSMKAFDSMMNDLKGQRMKNLYMHRRAGNHIVNLLCHAIPPELIYAVDNHIPVNVCMAAGELEPYAESYTQGMCPLTRSMIGLNNTGMCVFFNVADYAIGNDLCPNLKKTTDIFKETCNDLVMYMLDSSENNGKTEVNFKGLYEWIDSITDGQGFNMDGFIQYSRKFTAIRKLYKEINELRKADNPPINGRNALWTQQLFLVSDPDELENALKNLKAEMLENIKNHKGYNNQGNKKRVMLITPRIMPPFAEIFRVIEHSDAVVVCEEMCMGISNVTYDLDTMLSTLDGNKENFEKAAGYMLNSLDRSECSCHNGFDKEKIMKKIEDYKVDAVVNFSFSSCPCMEEKIQSIHEFLTAQGVPALNFVTNYMEIYENDASYIKKITEFLHH